METIGFVGLGVMGRPMVRNLIKAGYKVIAYDLNAEAVREAVQNGAAAAASVRDIAGGVPILITMLPDSPDVRAVILGQGGAIEALKRGSTVVDMSTISPQVTREIAEALAQQGVTFFDAPVSGGAKGAIEGTLSIMVGGPQGAYQAILPLLQAMGTTITWMGEAGAGQCTKMCNQLITAMHIQAVAEALALARAEGIDLPRLHKVLMGGAASSWILGNLGPLMLERDTRPNFRIDLHTKDLKIVIDSAFRRNVPVPGTMLCSSLFLETRAHGEGSLGNQCLHRAYDRMANQDPGDER
jgi:2-hydroxy-3-oxopropionate reductase